MKDIRLKKKAVTQLGKTHKIHHLQRFSLFICAIYEVSNKGFERHDAVAIPAITHNVVCSTSLDVNMAMLNEQPRPGPHIRRRPIRSTIIKFNYDRLSEPILCFKYILV